MSARRVVGLAVIVGVSVAAGGCRRHTRVVPDALSWTEELTPGTTVHLRTTNGDVTVRGTAEAQAHVQGIKRWSRGRERDVQFVVSRSGDDVYVCAIWVRRGGRCGDERYRPRPPRILAMFSLFKRRTDMNASLDVAIPAGVDVDATTVNGRVVVTEASGDVKAETVNGEIRASTMGGALELSTVNGSIRARAASLAKDAEVKLHTVNGSVSADLPQVLDADVQLETVNGRISTDFPIEISGKAERNSLRGTIGQGGRRIELKTVNGSVELRREAGSEKDEAMDWKTKAERWKAEAKAWKP